MTEAQHHPLYCSVVQLRVRDFARRTVAEQARLGAQLDTVLATLLPDIASSRRIVLQGSGMAAVAVLGDPPAALRLAECALRANQAGLELCAGLDHGPVEAVSTDAGESLGGDGMNSAALMAAFAAPASLLATRSFRTALAQAAPGSHYTLVAAGSFSDAALRTYDAYALDGQAPWRRRRRFVFVAVMTVVILVGTAVAVRLLAPQRPRPLAPWLDSAATQLLNLKPRWLREQK